MTEQTRAEFTAFGDRAVRQAAGMLRERFGLVDAMSKGHFDLVTEADLAVENRFGEQLAAELPDHSFLGEEGVKENRCDTRGFCWVLDPLDGTMNYASGVPLFAVSLALLHDGRPQLAWVKDVIGGDLFHAELGRGATLNGKPLPAEGQQDEVLPLGISTGFVRWATSIGDGSLLARVLQRFHKFRLFGSQALQLCYAASGRLVGTISRESKLWDDAAGALVVTECGRKYTGYSGEDVFPLPQDSPAWRGQAMGCVVGTPSTHRDLLELVEETVSNTGSLP